MYQSPLKFQREALTNPSIADNPFFDTVSDIEAAK
jgi:hypothetical protein